MLKLSDIMQRDVVAVSPELTLRELIGVLTEAGVSGAPVIANGDVVGVISATDFLEFQGETPGVPIAREGLQESPTANEAEVGGETSLPEFFSQMWEPTEADALERIHTSDSPEWNVLEEYTVADAMTRDILSQPADTSLKKAAGYMLEHDVHRLLVIDDGELQGIVTTSDIVRAVAEGKLKG